MNNNMFENNDFFKNINKNDNGTKKVEVKLPKVQSNIVFGIISIVSSIIGFCVMFGGYSILNLAKAIVRHPFSNIKLMVYLALIMFSLSAIIFGIMGMTSFYKKEKSCTSATINLIISILGFVLGIITVIMSFVFFFMQ